MISRRAAGWLGPGLVAALALVLRLWNLGRPNRLIFDETYYAKDAYSLLQHGYVQDFVEDANERIVDGDLGGLTTGEPSQIAHPDGGKWLIALGEQLLGMDSVGWRVSAAVVGALTVLILGRLVLRLTGSAWVATLAALLLCLDGVHFVMSRTALLDGFLTFWVVAGVAALVADRDWIRTRLDAAPPLWRPRPWQIVAGPSFGMAVGTKWSGLYVLAGFGLTVVAWEVAARRRVAAHHPTRRTPGRLRLLLVTGLPAFVTIVGLASVVYLLTWTGFLIHWEAYAARFGGGAQPWGAWVDDPSPGPFGAVADALRTLWHFHVLTFDFHTGDYLAGKTHPYESHPIGWLVLERPVAFDAQNDLPAESCGAPADSSCMREVTALGNPAVWWTGAVALLVSVVAWARTRDGRWAVPVVGLVTTWLPWFVSSGRPIFAFYAVVTLPFTVIAIALVIDALRRRATTPRRRYAVALGSGLLVLATVACFVYFHPIYTGALIAYDDWYARMWFPRWI